MASILLPHAECHFLSSRASILIFADKPLFYGAPTVAKRQHGRREKKVKRRALPSSKGVALLL